MSRDPNDIRITLVVRALDRAVASPHNLVECVGSKLVELGDTCEVLTGFEPDAIRAIVMAYSLNAPDAWLDRMAKQAIEEYSWCEWWDRDGEAEGRGQAVAS